jgi:hypothetical protein
MAVLQDVQSCKTYLTGIREQMYKPLPSEVEVIDPGQGRTLSWRPCTARRTRVGPVAAIGTRGSGHPPRPATAHFSSAAAPRSPACINSPRAKAAIVPSRLRPLHTLPPGSHPSESPGTLEQDTYYKVPICLLSVRRGLQPRISSASSHVSLPLRAYNMTPWTFIVRSATAGAWAMTDLRARHGPPRSLLKRSDHLPQPAVRSCHVLTRLRLRPTRREPDRECTSPLTTAREKDEI